MWLLPRQSYNGYIIWQTQNKDEEEFVVRIMNYKNAKISTGVIAGITGLLFARLYVGPEILCKNQASK